MAIDLGEDKLIRLVDVPALSWLPVGRGGKPLNASTVWRWHVVGLKDPDGRTQKLEAVKAGASLCTTEPALRDFFRRLSGGDEGPARTPTERIKSHRKAEADLAAAGI